jgi:hypothetical protein
VAGAPSTPICTGPPVGAPDGAPDDAADPDDVRAAVAPAEEDEESSATAGDSVDPVTTCAITGPARAMVATAPATTSTGTNRRRPIPRHNAEIQRESREESGEPAGMWCTR